VNSIIFERVARTVFPVALVFALYLLLRGHDRPGGGFIAGLVMASTIILQALAFGGEATRRSYASLLRPGVWLGLGIALGAGLPILRGKPALSHYHGEFRLPVLDTTLKLGTAQLFDLGIFLVVVGSTATVLALFVEPMSGKRGTR
jgi:multisubunit Na+/H+ antiporter MnhB subunit